ncbi:multidrug effflux MFS transporter [Phenylobacterium sp.]|uniref:multidrug effflux MFS transporter n=1 Tax=Phenylobacterium sp. TaxID=1871053 RepID=UPI0025D33167|nr:multidrug effflux MFS transporter [Phenylobacterium sp.]MBX3483776.1 multidrug effflux MFS transporter [Phenylobacterium sp.]MCW5758993.1 multidrug effflux MFS transporter [Phenylobacterium sp.]
MGAVTSANESSATPPPPTPWGLVVLLGSLTAMGPLAIDMYLPSLPAIAAGLRADPAEAQATVAAFLAGMAVGQPFYGPWSDRIGRRVPIVLGVVIFIVASAACAMATSATMLLAARFVQALGACAGGVVARAVIRDRFDHTETARMLSLMMLIMGLAPILAPILGSMLLTVGGWQSNFWFMTAVGVALLLAAALRMTESRSEATAIQASKENPFQAYAALLRQPRLIGYALAGALNGATLFTYISSSPGLIMGAYGYSPGVYPWIFGINALGVIGTGQINRIVLRRMTPDAVLRRASTVAVVFAVLMTIAAVSGIGGQWTVLPLLFLLLSSYGFMQGNTMAGALNVDPLRAGAISALMGTLSFATGAAASSLTALFHDDGPRTMALVMLAALLGSAASLRLLALRQ